MDVSVDNGTLTIRAERSGRTEESVEWLASERFVGSYMRQLALGDGIDTERIAATYEGGVLTVTIPMAERAKPRRIQIDTKAEHTVISGTAEPKQVADT